jgi:DNA polymerase-4/DNA polymerase V
MAWNAPRSFPRAIMHIDGDSFFAACEVVKNPSLRGKPVITGKERGIVSACTYEAKARGVKRAMTISEVRKICPDAVILPSDYETYSIVSQRMYSIVRRYTPAVEEYSIDECFADLTGLRHAKAGFGLAEAGMRDRPYRMSYEEIAAAIQRDLETSLGMTFSIGLSATKVLAKIGSKWKKPNGLTLLPLRDSTAFLKATPVGAVWGIGPQTTAYLQKFGIRTALDFAQREEEWVRQTVSKPFQEIWHELNGRVVYELDTTGRETYQSIQKTKTFTPPSRDAAFIYSQLSKNVENACIKARRWSLITSKIAFFLKTQEFRYHGAEVKLAHATNVPQDILAAIKPYFGDVLRGGIEYRTTGVTLLDLQDDVLEQLDLFGAHEHTHSLQAVYESVDELSRRYGKHAVFLASSFGAMSHGAHRGERGDAADRTKQLFKGETARKRLGITYLGEIA